MNNTDFTIENINSNYIVRNQVKNVYYLSPETYGVVGDGITDDTVAFNKFLTDCREKKRIGFVPVPSVSYKISAPLDVGGVHIESVDTNSTSPGLYPIACIIEGDGTFPIMEQISTESNNSRICIKNFNLQNGTIGLKLTKSIMSIVENVFVQGCPIGFQIGDNTITGPLWVELKQCMAYYCSTAGLLLEGDDGNGNAIYCDTCYFRGFGASSYSVIQNVSASSLQGVSNSFFNCEIVNNDGVGIHLINGKNMQINNGYLECRGPVLKIENNNTRQASCVFNDCLFASLYNSSQPENPTTASSWIWHTTPSSGLSQTCEVIVNGGYVLVGSGSQQHNLRLVSSDDPDKLVFKMPNQPTLSTQGSTGFQLFGAGLPTDICRVQYSSTYTPVWTTISGTAPDISGGSLTGQYTLNGNMCHVNIAFQAGSGTTFGTADWRFSLPFIASANEISIGNCIMKDDDTGNYYTGLVDKQNGDEVQILLNNNGSAVKNNNPFTWTTDDLLNITIQYRLGGYDP